MIKLIRNMAVVAVVLFSLTGCFKKVTTATTLISTGIVPCLDKVL